MRLVKRLFITLICSLLIVGLSGCWNSRELEVLGIVLGVGIDKAEEDGEIKFIAQVVDPLSMQSAGRDVGGGGEKAYWNVEETGSTVFSAIRSIYNKSSKKLFFPHTQVLVFGQDVAENGIFDSLDFFFRDHETRLNVWVFVAEGEAGKVLDIEPKLDKIPSNNITKLIKAQEKNTSQIPAVRLSDVKARLMSKTTALIVPIIGVTGKDDDKVAELKGTAVFKEDRMVGKLDKKESRGLLWVLGDVQSGVVDVKTEKGNNVSLEIIRVKGNVKAELVDGKVVINVSVMEEGNLAEQTGFEDLSNPTSINYLESLKMEAIKEEILAAVKKSQELNADIFGFGEAVNRAYPKEWKDMESKWDEIFPTVEVNVDVSAKIRLIGRIDKPSVPQ